MPNATFSSSTIYAWHGLENSQIITGYLVATSKKNALSLLEQQQIIIISVKRTNKLSTFYYNQQGILLFFEQLQPLLEIGIPLLASLELINQQLSTIWQRLLYLLKQHINQGETLSEALNHYTTLFPKMYIYFIKIGEISGSFNECLSYLICYQQQRLKQQQHFRQTLQYPLFILSSAIILLIIVLLFILPEMEKIYLLNGTALPFITQLLLKINHQISNLLPWFGSLTTLFVLVYRKSRLKNHSIQQLEQTCFSHLPYIRIIQRHAFLSHFFHTLYLLHRVGIPLFNSLDTIIESLNINPYHSVLCAIKKMLLTGHPLHYCLKQYPVIFSPLCCQLIYIGEESGDLERMFLKLHEQYRDTVTKKILKLSHLIGPLTTIAIGLFIGFIVFAIYTPLFQLGDVLV